MLPTESLIKDLKIRYDIEFSDIEVKNKKNLEMNLQDIEKPYFEYSLFKKLSR